MMAAAQDPSGGVVVLWGLVASGAMVTVETAALWLGWTRLSLPIMLGALFVSDRDRAAFLGTLMHFVLGLGFAWFYTLVFRQWGAANWWLGALMGLAHAIFILVVILPVLPAVHPRMVGPRTGPETVAALESPGLLGLHYGRATAVVSLATHGVYGAVLGLLYHL